MHPPRSALNLVLWTAEKYVVVHVRHHLPNIGEMRLKNVDSVEVDLAAILLLSELIQCGSLPPKWRSSVAPKNESDRTVSPGEARSVERISDLRFIITRR
jgi:hypothetical protein